MDIAKAVEAAQQFGSKDLSSTELDKRVSLLMEYSSDIGALRQSIQSDGNKIESGTWRPVFTTGNAEIMHGDCFDWLQQQP